MPHVTMPQGLPPGTPGLMMYRPETGRPISQLVEVLMRGESSLSRSDREMMAAYVSQLNNCDFCVNTHGEISAQQSPDGRALVDKVLADVKSAPLSPKLRALMNIAEAVVDSGKNVTTELVEAARKAGADDTDIHDAVLTSAAFCMFNRYCDGMDAVVPEDPQAYVGMAAMLIREGYSTCADGH